MKSESTQQILNRLLDELTSLLDEYHTSLERDEIFEVRKNIRTRIKQLQRRIEEIKSTSVITS